MTSVKRKKMLEVTNNQIKTKTKRCNFNLKKLAKKVCILNVGENVGK